MKTVAWSQWRASLLNILTKSDRLRLSPGLEMTASISRLAEERKLKRRSTKQHQAILTEVYQVKKCW